MKMQIVIFTLLITVFAAPAYAASKIHGRQYSEGPNCFNIQPHHHFDRTLRFRNQCSLDVTGLYCFVDTGNGHGTCENGKNHPLLRSDKTAWPEKTALEEFRKEFEKSGRRITVKGGKKKNLANLDFKVKLTGIIWSACYVEDIAADKCRIKPASQLWREKSAPPKQDAAPKQAAGPEPKLTPPKQLAKPKPPVPKQVEKPEQLAVPKRAAELGQSPEPNPVTETSPSAGVAQTSEADCILLPEGVNVCGDTAKNIVRWGKTVWGVLYAFYLAHAAWIGLVTMVTIIMVIPRARAKIWQIITRKNSASN